MERICIRLSKLVWSLNMKQFYILLVLSYFLMANSVDDNISKLWTSAKIELEYSLDDLDNSSLELYFLGINSYNILSYAFAHNKNEIVDEILDLYMSTLPYLTNSNSYTFNYLQYNHRYSTRILQNSYPLWLDNNKKEDVLASSEFLFVISFAINRIKNLPIERRTKRMKIFIKQFSSIVSSHYRRWILGAKSKENSHMLGVFERRSWGCKKKKSAEYICARPLNQIILELDSYRGNSYCNSMTDAVMLINIGLGYYLSSNPNTLQKEELTSFFKESVALFSSHFKSHISYDFNKKKIETLGFEEGVWSKHPDFLYSLYTDNSFPLEKYQKVNQKVGIDVSHAGTVFAFLDMLVNHKEYFNIKFPTSLDIKMFSNRFLYNVFNGDFQKPLFYNYMNGSNGWFRVSSHGSGYAPYNLTSTVLVQGYPKLGAYNLELKRVFREIYNKLNSQNIKDREFIKEFYQKTIWSNHHLKNEYNFYADKIDSHTALFLINFYSLLI